MFAKPHSALVIAGHGSTVNPDSSAPTFAHAGEIRRRGLFGEVACAFWMEQPALREVLNTVECDDVYVVPNFISKGYFTRNVIPRELGLAGEITVRGARTIKYCEPVGNHPRMTELLLWRVREVAPDVPPCETSLLIIGHGTSRNENSSSAVKEQVRRILAHGEYAEVLGAFLEEEPFVTGWREVVTQPNVVAVPFFISDGLHGSQDIPALLGIGSGRMQAAEKTAGFRRYRHFVDGRAVHYAGAIGTEPQFADLILDQVEAFDLRHANAVGSPK